MKTRNRFTLVELLVTMGVFCVLLMVSMQIFGSAGKLWTRSEQKSNTFAAARVAMEFVAARIQTCVYTYEVPFQIYNKKGSGNNTYYTDVFFPTTVPMNRVFKDNASGSLKKLDKLSVRFVGFSLTDGVLQMRIFSDKMNDTAQQYNDFSQLLPPYRKRNGTTYDDACENIENALKLEPDSKYQIDKSRDHIDIIENVTAFKLIPFNPVGKASYARIELDDDAGAVISTPPYLLEIEISVLDSKESFRKWKSASDNEKKEIETESGYTFRRAVLLGDRRSGR